MGLKNNNKKGSLSFMISQQKPLKLKCKENKAQGKNKTKKKKTQIIQGPQDKYKSFNMLGIGIPEREVKRSRRNI